MNVDAGFALIILAILLFIAELFVVSFGLLTLAGLVALVFGIRTLVEEGYYSGVSPWFIAVVAIFIAGFLFYAITRVIAAHKSQAQTGREELIGKTATVKTVLAPEGTVLYKGELWTAVSGMGTIEPGEEVTIIGIDGLKLHVTKKK